MIIYDLIYGRNERRTVLTILDCAVSENGKRHCESLRDRETKQSEKRTGQLKIERQQQE